MQMEFSIFHQNFFWKYFSGNRISARKKNCQFEDLNIVTEFPCLWELNEFYVTIYNDSICRICKHICEFRQKHFRRFPSMENLHRKFRCSDPFPAENIQKFRLISGKNSKCSSKTARTRLNSFLYKTFKTNLSSYMTILYNFP